MSQSSVNCSKNSALTLEGCDIQRVLSHRMTEPIALLRLWGGGRFLTVKVGFLMAEVVLVASTEVDEDSTASSVSSARTWPRRAAEE